MTGVGAVTGSRTGATIKQSRWLFKTLRDNGFHTIHHGACVGVDRLAHQQAMWLGINLVVHPPLADKHLAPECLQRKAYPVPGSSRRAHVVVLSPKPYLDRDRDMVNAAQELLALPKGMPEPHSGTWFTVKYAVSKHIPVRVCMPDGHVLTAEEVGKALEI